VGSPSNFSAEYRYEQDSDEDMPDEYRRNDGFREETEVQTEFGNRVDQSNLAVASCSCSQDVVVVVKRNIQLQTV